MAMPRAVVALGLVTALAGTGVHGDALVEQGRYLVVAGDCEACHTDPAHVEQRFAGGRGIETPFGEVAAPNITPDRETGIGGWSDEQFDAALRRGLRLDGKHLYPAMPYPYYARMSSDDTRAMRAYLQTLPAVHNAVEADRLPFPLSVRALMGAWNALYFTPGEYQADPSQSSQWNRGAYLVQGPGHCEACHTPKSLLGGDEHGKALRGYTIQGWFSPDLTENTARGLSAWSVDDLAEYLKSGHNRYAAAAGPMAEEVQFSSSQMTDDDLHAIAQYLKMLPGEAASPQAPQPLAHTDSYMAAGAAIYQDLCTACHAADGRGVAYLIPNIAVSGSVAAREPTTLLRVLLQGSSTVGTSDAPTAPAMPGFGLRLDDEQVAAVATYVRNSWGHAASAVGAADVKNARATLQAKPP